jgi:uncharacterized protein (UPF0333 family)
MKKLFLLFYISFFAILVFYIIFTIYTYMFHFWLDYSNIQIINNSNNHYQLYFEMVNNTSNNYDESYNESNCIPIRCFISNISTIKNSIKYTSKNAVHKIKVFERTLSWFFKGSKPGGGRGL